MPGTRELLAGVLGIGLGLVLIAAPALVVRVHTAGRLPHDRRGGYGSDGELPAKFEWLIRLVGLACVALGGYFLYGFVG